MGYVLSLSRPDLMEVLRRRFRALRLRILDRTGGAVHAGVFLSRGSSSVALDEAEVEDFLGTLDRLNLDLRENSDFLWDLGNQSLRRVLYLIGFVCRYDEARQRRFMDDDPSIRGPKDLQPRELVIKSLMVSDTPLYGSEGSDGAILPNVFRFERSSEVGAAAVYWLLSFMSGVGTPVRRREFCILGEQCMLSASSASRVMSYLLNQDLLEEAQYDIGTTSIEYIQLSPLGRVLLSELVEDPDYLYQVVADCDLPDAALRDALERDPTCYVSRIGPLLALWKGVAWSEAGLLRALKSVGRRDVLRMISMQGLLSERMRVGLSEVAGWGPRSSDEHVRRAGKDLGSSLSRGGTFIGSVRKALDDALGGHGTVLLPDLFESLELYEGTVTVRMPKVPQPAPHPRLEIEVAGGAVLGKRDLLAVASLDATGLELRQPCQMFSFRDSGSRVCGIPVSLTGEPPSLRGFHVRALTQGERWFDLYYDVREGASLFERAVRKRNEE
jgi:hypothetical protein